MAKKRIHVFASSWVGVQGFHTNFTLETLAFEKAVVSLQPLTPSLVRRFVFQHLNTAPIAPPTMQIVEPNNTGPSSPLTRCVSHLFLTRFALVLLLPAPSSSRIYSNPLPPLSPCSPSFQLPVPPRHLAPTGLTDHKHGHAALTRDRRAVAVNCLVATLRCTIRRRMFVRPSPLLCA